MIKFIFGGEKVPSESSVYYFNPTTKGDLTRFAKAIGDSLQIIVQQDFYGREISRSPANDPMIVHLFEDNLQEFEAAAKINAYYLLARDAQLEFVILSLTERGKCFAQNLLGV